MRGGISKTNARNDLKKLITIRGHIRRALSACDTGALIAIEALLWAHFAHLPSVGVLRASLPAGGDRAGDLTGNLQALGWLLDTFTRADVVPDPQLLSLQLQLHDASNNAFARHQVPA